MANCVRGRWSDWRWRRRKMWGFCTCCVGMWSLVGATPGDEGIFLKMDRSYWRWSLTIFKKIPSSPWLGSNVAAGLKRDGGGLVTKNVATIPNRSDLFCNQSPAVPIPQTDPTNRSHKPIPQTDPTNRSHKPIPHTNQW